MVSRQGVGNRPSTSWARGGRLEGLRGRVLLDFRALTRDWRPQEHAPRTRESAGLPSQAAALTH